MSNSETNRQWWLGVADLGTTALHEGSKGIQRVHLSIADETFNVLEQIPVTRPFSEPVRSVHHGVSRLVYGAVSVSSRMVNERVRKG